MQLSPNRFDKNEMSETVCPKTAQDIPSGFNCPESINCKSSFSWSQCRVSCLCVQIFPWKRLEQSNNTQLSVSGFIRFESRKDIKEKDIRHIVACHIASHVISSQSSAAMYKIPDDVLNHLYRLVALCWFTFEVETNSIYLNCSRFFTVDEEELSDLMQICYRVEQAHWYYNKWYSLDLTQDGLLSEASLKPCDFKEVLVNFLSVKLN